MNEIIQYFILLVMFGLLIVQAIFVEKNLPKKVKPMVWITMIIGILLLILIILGV